MSEILDKFVEQIKAAYGERLKSVVLYGSHAMEDTHGKSDYNLIIVLDAIKYDDLFALNKDIAKWVKQGNPAPLLFTEEYLKSSSDVFPIEFLDIKESRKILFGKDYFKNLELSGANLRHELEFELKSKLLKLRQGCMLSGEKERVFRELLISSISSILSLSRHVLRLLGETPPAKKMESLEILARKTGLDRQVFETIMKMKISDKEALKTGPREVMGRYLQEIEKMADIVDKMEE